MVTTNNEIMVVLSQAFIVSSNSTKLQWLWIAFLLCLIKVETVK